MRGTIWAVVACMGVGLAVPALADDPPAAGGEGTGQETTPAGDRTDGDRTTDGGTALRVEAARNGAGSMEPADAETQEERAERQFAESVWNSP